jgi:excisionase family DNA binding protein
MAVRRNGESPTDPGNALPPVLTMREATRLLNVHGNTLRRWSDQGVIKAYRLGPRGERRFKREDIYALFVEHASYPRASAGEMA